MARPSYSYYAVAKGRQVGVFRSWNEAKKYVDGYSGAVHKGFSNEADARGYLLANGSSATSTTVPTNGNSGIESASSHSTVRPQFAHDDQDDGTKAPADESLDRLDFSNLSISDSVCNKSEATEPEPPAEGNDGDDNKEANAASALVGRFYERASRSAAEAPPNPQDEVALVAFCAEGAPGNGTPDCRAAYACLFPKHEDWNVVRPVPNDDRATNNRAEFLSALEAMTRANTENPAHDQVLFIFTSCLLLIRSMTEWIDNWVANGWQKSNGKPVKNRDLLEQLRTAQGDRRILWCKVKAHTGLADWESKWHELASLEARRAAA